MVLENLLNDLQPRPWWKAADVYLLVENQYDPARGRLDAGTPSCPTTASRCGAGRTGPAAIGSSWDC